MLKTDGNILPVLRGADTQDFEEIQKIEGCFPFQVGLQKRLPGKLLDRNYSFPIGSIYVFYNVFGRNYRFTDFGVVEIEEVDGSGFTPPTLPPIGNIWIDDFEGYPDTLISKFWAAGAWLYFVGIAETYTEKTVDIFEISDSPLNVDIGGDHSAGDYPYSTPGGSRPIDPVTQPIVNWKPENCSDVFDEFNPADPEEITYPLTDILQSLIGEQENFSTDCAGGAIISGFCYALDSESPMIRGVLPYPGVITDGVTPSLSLQASYEAVSRELFTGFFSYQQSRRAARVITRIDFSLEELYDKIGPNTQLYLVGTHNPSVPDAQGAGPVKCAAAAVSPEGLTEGTIVIEVNDGQTHIFGVPGNQINTTSNSVIYTHIVARTIKSFFKADE